VGKKKSGAVGKSGVGKLRSLEGIEKVFGGTGGI
jgi:hypothetical protein